MDQELNRHEIVGGAFMEAEGDPDTVWDARNKWLFSTGATINTCINEIPLVDEKPSALTVRTVVGSVDNVRSEGLVTLTDSLTGNSLKITAVKAPGFTENMISFSALHGMGYNLDINNTCAKILYGDSGEVAFKFIREGDGRFYMTTTDAHFQSSN